MTSIPRNLRDTYLPAKGAAESWERQSRRESISGESGGELSGLGDVPTETKHVGVGGFWHQVKDRRERGLEKAVCVYERGEWVCLP